MSDRRPDRHGTRWTYQRGCRCLQCRRAEATYRGKLRRDIAKGRTPAGRRVDARATWRRIRSLLIEEFTKAEIARRLGLKRARLELDTQTVTRQTELRILAFYEDIMAESPELKTQI